MASADMRGTQSLPFCYDNNPYPPAEWDNGTWTIQNWLERTAWRTLQNTEYGRPRVEQGINPGLFEDPLLRQVYLIDVALFINAERTSVQAVSGMMRCAPDENSQIFLGTQVMDECRHYEVFCRRMADFGITPEQRQRLVAQYTTPSMRAFYDLILEQVDKRDFFASSVAQNLVLEGMAYPLYRYEIKYWSKLDPSLSQIIRGAFADEAHHVGFGEAIGKFYVKNASAAERSKIIRLLRDFSALLENAFKEVITHYIGLYQECANAYMEVMGDIEIFPGRRMAEVTEEDQVHFLMKEIRNEHERRVVRMGVM